MWQAGYDSNLLKATLGWYLARPSLKWVPGEILGTWKRLVWYWSPCELNDDWSIKVWVLAPYAQHKRGEIYVLLREHATFFRHFFDLVGSNERIYPFGSFYYRLILTQPGSVSHSYYLYVNETWSHIRKNYFLRMAPMMMKIPATAKMMPPTIARAKAQDRSRLWRSAVP